MGFCDPNEVLYFGMTPRFTLLLLALCPFVSASAGLRIITHAGDELVVETPWGPRKAMDVRGLCVGKKVYVGTTYDAVPTQMADGGWQSQMTIEVERAVVGQPDRFEMLWAVGAIVNGKMRGQTSITWALGPEVGRRYLMSTVPILADGVPTDETLLNFHHPLDAHAELPPAAEFTTQLDALCEQLVLPRYDEVIGQLQSKPPPF